ncbi:Violaxanthin de-epoxidase, chloroplastic [Gossypium arboreum]|uniref:Violaxanthin de-epoxidase, chloroplastic n=1 Tax=Gossypium arboreum TaxID=29729 RepID=A0A0B0MRD9_GOSAR|nr:Violaxanthin de-epoxidase, chloroplastic [Gossypium arboreum]
MFNYCDECMNDFIVYEHNIVNKFDDCALSRKSRLNLRNDVGYNYCQASSGIKEHQRLDHTIN